MDTFDLLELQVIIIFLEHRSLIHGDDPRGAAAAKGEVAAFNLIEAKLLKAMEDC